MTKSILAAQCMCSYTSHIEQPSWKLMLPQATVHDMMSLNKNDIIIYFMFLVCSLYIQPICTLNHSFCALKNHFQNEVTNDALLSLKQ